MEPYEELGVERNATTAEIRQAYVQLARQHHPDRHQDATDESDAERMAKINAAWTVLSDERRRATYDAALDGDRRQDGATVRDAGDTWQPLDGDDAVDPDMFDDTPTGARPMPRMVALLPAALLAAGTVAMLFGFLVQVAPLLGLGMALVVGAGIAFVAIPVIAMIGASRAERDW